MKLAYLRQEALAARVEAFAHCRRYVALALLERRKFKRLGAAYRWTDAPGLIRDGAMISAQNVALGVSPTLFAGVEGIIFGAAYSIHRLVPGAPMDAPLIPWARVFCEGFASCGR